jgi:RNA recognition motif-containing protein
MSLDSSNFNFDSSGKLFVGSIASTTTREDLLRLFAPFGPVAEVVVLAERDGRPKFSAFVNMRRRSDAQRAIETLDRSMTLPNAKKILEVRFAQPQTAPGNFPAGRPQRALSTDTSSVATTAPSSPKTPSRQPELVLGGKEFKVRLTESGELMTCECAFTAVLLWMELVEAQVAADLVPCEF